MPENTDWDDTGDYARVLDAPAQNDERPLSHSVALFVSAPVLLGAVALAALFVLGGLGAVAEKLGALL